MEDFVSVRALYKMDRISVCKKFSRKNMSKLFHRITGRKDSRIINAEDDVIRSGICRHESNINNISYSEAYMRLLDGNKEYVEEKTKLNPNYFFDLAKNQTPKYLLISCSDSRVPPNEMTRTDPGEIFIHRNIGSQVIFSDLNCMSVIQYAVEYLKVEHIIVMGHTKCGAITASLNKNFKGLIDNWLQNIKDVALLNKNILDTCKNEEEFIKKLTELNIKAQALNVCKTPFVQRAWSEGRDIHVHGWLCDIETGLIEDLAINNSDWNDIKNVYTHHFNNA
jgi:carbonic anhydrase